MLTRWGAHAAESTSPSVVAVYLALRDTNVKALLAAYLSRGQLFVGPHVYRGRTSVAVDFMFTYPPNSLDPAGGITIHVEIDPSLQRVLGVREISGHQRIAEGMATQAKGHALSSHGMGQISTASAFMPNIGLSADSGGGTVQALAAATLAGPGDGGITVDGQGIPLINGSGSRTVALAPPEVDIYVVLYGPTATYTLSWSVTINGVTKSESPTQQGGGRFAKLYKYPFPDFNLSTGAVA